jgi:hypothetical protein
MSNAISPAVANATPSDIQARIVSYAGGTTDDYPAGVYPINLGAPADEAD